MNNSKSFSSKLGQYLLLMRLNNPSGFLLLFYPCLMTLALYQKPNQEFINLAILLALCSLIIRTVGCIINDLIDKDLDSKVERTKSRPLASGSLSVQEAIALIFALLIIEFFLIIQFPFRVILISFCLFPFIIIYPLIKRFSYLPQVFLGIIFNFGVIVTFNILNIPLKISVILLYLACIFWTIAYDTIYGFADHIYDKKIAVKSTALLIEKRNYKLILFFGYVFFVLLLVAAKYLEYGTNYSILSDVFLLLALGIIFWQVMGLDILNSKDCIKRFKSNNILGLLMVLYIAS